MNAKQTTQQSVNANVNVNENARGANAAAASGGSSGGTLALLACAMLIGALLINRLASDRSALTELGQAAYAQAVNQGGASETSLLTVEAGSNDEVLVVLDQRREEMLVYRVQNQRAVDFKSRVSLKGLFTQARGNTPRTNQPPMPGATPGGR